MAAIAYGTPNSALNTTGWLNATKAPYNADPTGGTDATAAVNAALAATPAGGVCYLPGGSELLISGTLVIPDNVTLMGDSASDFTGGSVIRVADGANLDAVISDATWSSNGSFNSTAPRVVGIIVDGNGANQTAGKGVGIAFCAYRGEVIGCRVQNTRGDGIRLTNSNAAGTVITGFCVECKLVDNTVETPGMGNLSANTEGIAIRDTGSHVTDYWVTRNVVYTTTTTNGSGIWADSAGGAIVSDNHTYGTGLHGISISGASETRVTNNYVEFFGQLASSGACYGIAAVDDGGGPGTVVSGNVININDAVSGNTFTAIHLENPGSGDPAFYALGPNMMYTSVPAATALEINDQGDAGNFTVAMMPQTATGFTTPYILNNFATITGAPFAGYQQPAWASTMSVDPALGTTITIVLGGDLTLELPAQFPAGMQLTFVFQQPGSGGTYNYTVTFSSTGGYSGGGEWQDVTFTAATGAGAFSAVSFTSDGFDLTQIGQAGGGGGGGSGTVTSASVVTANGFAGTVANATTTPAITVETTVTGLMKGNGTAVSAAASGTDYAPATSGTAILKGSGSGGFSNAASGTDYAPATSGTALLKGNGSGGFSSATAGTDYVTPTGSGAALTGITVSQVSGAAPLASAALTGAPTTPTPSTSTGIANKAYVDSVAAGLDAKPSVAAVATSNITLSGTQTVDGVALTAGQRALATGQSTASQNGLWVVAAGSWTRPTDFASASSQLGAFAFVEAGTVGASSGWTLVGASAVTVDTSSQTWTQFSGAGEILAGTGLTKTGNTIAVTASTYDAFGAASTAQSNAETYSSPTTTLGDTIYGGASGVPTRLAGNTTATKKFWTQTGTGSASAAPGWNGIVSGDIPNNAANTTGNAATATNLAGGATLPDYLAPAVSALTYGTSVAVNAALGNAFNLTLTASTATIANPTNPAEGQVIRFRITQGTGGSFTVAWGTAYDFGTGSAPTLSTTAAKVDIIAFEYVASISKWCCLGSGLGY